MSVRDTMAGLIAAVRALVDDPAEGTPVFSDQQFQDALDHNRQDINYLELASKITIQPGGAVLWLDYYAMVGTAGLGDWEQDAVLQGYPDFATLTPITSDWLVGHWTFDTSLYTWGQRPPVYIIGKVYDRYAAAVEILEKWAARMSRNYNTSADGQRFNLVDQRTGLLQLAAEYKQRVQPRYAQMTRSDLPSKLWQQGAFDISRTTF